MDCEGYRFAGQMMWRHVQSHEFSNDYVMGAVQVLW